MSLDNGTRSERLSCEALRRGPAQEAQLLCLPGYPITVQSTLPDGRVLVSGGYAGIIVNTVCIYTPSRNMWSEIASLPANVSITRFLETLEKRDGLLAELDGETPDDITLYCTYKADDISDIDFLDCIIDFEAYCQRAAAAYIEDTQEYMFIKFLANDATKAAMLALMDDADNEVHIIAAIKRVLEKNTYKTVNVTTVIDGEELYLKNLKRNT